MKKEATNLQILITVGLSTLLVVGALSVAFLLAPPGETGGSKKTSDKSSKVALDCAESEKEVITDLGGLACFDRNADPLPPGFHWNDELK